MARALRIVAEGVWYHVTARGMDRQRIFRDDEDRGRLLQLFGEMTERYGVLIHAFALMPNHYHLVLATPEGNLSRAMQWLNVGYSVGFNLRHRRGGHLFQGRYKADVLELGEAALEVTRYVHLNPVRVLAMGMDKKARHLEEQGFGPALTIREVRHRIRTLRSYPWSSYADYASKRPVHGWVSTDDVLKLAGGVNEEGRRWYRGYVEEPLKAGLEGTPRQRTKAGMVLGSEVFVTRIKSVARGSHREQRAIRMLAKHGRVSFEAIVRAVEGEKGESWAAFRDRYGDWGRDAALYVARRKGRYTLEELAGLGGLKGYVSVGQCLRRFEARLKGDRDLERALARIDANCK